MRISESAIETIRHHSKATYPEECCGVLVGEYDDVTFASEAVPVANTSEEHRERRYTIDAAELFRVTRDAGKRGLDVVGFYHSHPDHPAEPSSTDLEEATFPSYVYLIQSVIDGKPDELTAWTLADDRSRFLREAIDELRNEPSSTTEHP